ncbi:MAG: carbon storage regulator [Gemmataceae bacterium]
MLVLSRKYGEEVVLPQQGITFTILEIRGDKVRVGITAPTEIPVYRREVWTRILQSRETEQPAVNGHHNGHNGQNGHHHNGHKEPVALGDV